MTETFRRELEQLSAQGHRDAAVRLVRTQLEAGGLTNERLRLASFLGHDISCTVLGPGGGPAPEETAGPWIAQLAALCMPIDAEPLEPGKAALLHACQAVGCVAVEFLEPEEPALAKSWSEFLQGMQGWLEAPSQAGHVSVLASMPRATGFAGQTLSRETFVLMSAAQAFKHPTSVGEHEVQTLLQALRLNEERMRQAIAQALIPWCLRGCSAAV